MLSPGVLALLLLNFLLIGFLPIMFFARGRLSVRWWLTAAPFFLCAGLLAAGCFGLLTPGLAAGPWQTPREVVAVLLGASSIGLIACAVGSHRIPVALWHQEDDAPQRIVNWGPYSRIRHPFYAAFLLALLGAFVFFPHVGTLLTGLYGATALSITARREETRLLASTLGQEYAGYMRRTGRFWPRSRGEAC